MNEPEYDRMYQVEECHWWYVALHELVLWFVSHERQRRGELRILDAGCGTGRLCQLLGRYGQVEGCDLADRALVLCRKRGLDNVFAADLNTAALGEGRYDVITSMDVLYHRAISDDRAVLAGFSRALRPGGLLLLNLPAFEFLRSSHDIAVQTGRRYTRKELVSRVTEAGFTVEAATYRLAPLFLPILLVRFGKRFLTSATDQQDIVSDVYPPAPLVNRILLGLTRWENRFLRQGSMPFGSSVFIAARSNND